MSNKLSIYVAAPFEDKDTAAKDAKDKLLAAGYEVTSRWIDLVTPKDLDKSNPEHEAYFAMEALHDLEDVFNADALVLLNTKQSEGKACETGMAIAWNKPIIIVGDRTQIFHWLPIPRVATIEDAIAAMDEFLEKQSKSGAFAVPEDVPSAPNAPKELVTLSE